jgi:cardiolipin synthase
MTQAEFSLWFAIFALAVDFVIRVVAIIVVPRNRRPSSALGWLLAIFFIPYIGVILFLLIGSPRLGRKRRRRQREINQFILDSTEGFDKVKHSKTWPAWLDRVVELNRNLGAMPLVGGNSAHMQIDYEKNIADIAADIDKAKNFVHVEFYILSSDSVTEPVFQAMQRAVERGVEVRVLFDHVAAMRTVGYRKTKKRLTKIGVDWHLMLPSRPT